jgi:hypothetical protein
MAKNVNFRFYCTFDGFFYDQLSDISTSWQRPHFQQQHCSVQCSKVVKLYMEIAVGMYDHQKPTESIHDQRRGTAAIWKQFKPHVGLKLMIRLNNFSGYLRPCFADGADGQGCLKRPTFLKSRQFHHQGTIFQVFFSQTEILRFFRRFIWRHNAPYIPGTTTFTCQAFVELKKDSQLNS